MSASKFCGYCRWFKEHSHAIMGECMFLAIGKSPAGINPLTMPSWGRYCAEWEIKDDKKDD